MFNRMRRSAGRSSLSTHDLRRLIQHFYVPFGQGNDPRQCVAQKLLCEPEGFHGDDLGVRHRRSMRSLD